MQCIITNCKNKAIPKNDKCEQHLFKFPRPKTCPVCFKSIHQPNRPLSCDHWVHRTCVKRSGKSECPICRTRLHDIGNISPINEPYEIPRNSVIFAVIAFKLYSNCIHKNNRILGLDHFIQGVLNVFLPENHPSYEGISIFLYAEALNYFFE